MELRPYQKESIQAINKEWTDGRKRTLLVLPTGCGKTIVFSHIAKEVVERNKRALILAHRYELLSQAQAKIKATTGLNSSLEKAEYHSLESDEMITVASIQTLNNDKRLTQFAPDYFDTIIVDEAHHSMSDSYQKVLNYFNQCKVLGCTATPDRADKRNLGNFFESLAYEYPLQKAIKEGYLSKLKALTIPLKIEIGELKTSQGDYQLSDVGNALEPYLEQIADEIKEVCKTRKKILVFLPLIETSKKFCELLKSKGIKATEVNGESTDRENILDDFRNGEYQVLCNSMLLTEGYDDPTIDCIVPLRLTKVRSLYSQMIGRGTRIAEGKEDCLIVDFLWQTTKHDLCRPAVLVAKDENIAKKITEKLENGEEGELLGLEEIAERDVLIERENALAEELKKQRNKKRGLVDPLQYAFSIMDEDIANYVPTFGYEAKAPTEKQLALIENFGISTENIETLGKAGLIIDKLMDRNSAGLSTPKQIRKLESYGFKRVGSWTKAQASKMMSIIANNHWLVPYNIKPQEYIPQ